MTRNLFADFHFDDRSGRPGITSVVEPINGKPTLPDSGIVAPAAR